MGISSSKGLYHQMPQIAKLYEVEGIMYQELGWTKLEALHNLQKKYDIKLVPGEDYIYYCGTFKKWGQEYYNTVFYEQNGSRWSAQVYL